MSTRYGVDDSAKVSRLVFGQERNVIVVNGCLVDDDAECLFVRITRYHNSATGTYGVAMADVLVLAASNDGLSMGIDVIDVESFPTNQT